MCNARLARGLGHQRSSSAAVSAVKDHRIHTHPCHRHRFAPLCVLHIAHLRHHTTPLPVFFFVAQNVWITTECNEAIGHNCASPDHHLVGVEYWSLPEVEGAMPVQCAGDSLPPYPDDDDPTYDTPPPVGTAWDTNPNPSDTYTDGFPNEGDWSSSLWMDDFDLTPSSLQGINDNDGSSDANDGAANNWSLDSSQSSTHYDMGSSADGS